MEVFRRIRTAELSASRKRLRGFWLQSVQYGRRWVVGMLCASQLSLIPAGSLLAADPVPTAVPEEARQSLVKLNHVAASWQKVLQELAQQSGSKLIAEKVPSGNFTRLDRREYTRNEAVRIINSEIEPKGFRLLEKGEYLFLIDIPSTRPRYQPAVIGPAHAPPPFAPAAPTQALESPSPYQRKFEPLRRQPAPATEIESTTASPRQRVRTVQHEEYAEPVRSNRPRVTAAMLEEEPAKSSQTLAYRVRRQTPTELARTVYKAFKSRAKLDNSGIDGLPAFHVFSVASDDAAGMERRIQFSISIDEENGELLIDAADEDVRAVVKLLKLIDGGMDGNPTRLVASSKYVCQIAAQLPDELNELRRARREAPARATLAQLDDDESIDRAFAAQDQEREEPAPEATEPKADDAPRPAVPKTGNPKLDEKIQKEVLGNLKGEVNIEAVPDLGVLILRGGEKDVEQVMQVIRELEKLSEGAAPEVHLMYLRNVDSDSLATLLTTVYEQLAKFPGLATQPRQAVAVIPVSKPNAVLIVAPAADLPSILDLAEELDQPVDPATEFQVFWLKSAVATKVSELIKEFYNERKGLDAKPLVVADPRSNSIVVRARPRDLDEITALVEKLDKGESGAVSQIQIFPLQNAVATELAQVLNAAIQSVLAPPQSNAGGQAGGALQGVSAGQVSDEFRDARSAVLQFLATDGTSERKLRSGILADIRITPDARMNSLLVSAPEQSLGLIGELIRAMDRPTSAVAEIKVFTLANADAQLMVTQLQALFPTQGQSNQGGQRAGNQLGVLIAGADDANSGLIPLKFSVDTRTNSVIAVGGAEALQVVEAILLRLDESDLRSRKNAVYRLKNSPAANIATSLQNFLTSQQQLGQNDPNLISNVEQLEREVIVVPETVNNSLLISATPRYFDSVMMIVEKLDAAPQQVVIQALLVEVELDNNDEFGVELGFQDPILFGRSTITNALFQNVTNQTNSGTVTTQKLISQEASPGFNFANPVLGLGTNNSANQKTVGSQALSSFSLGRTNGDLGYGGLVLSAGSDAVSVLLRALSATRRVQVLSRPQIRTLDNQQAQIIQGQVVPIVNGVTISAQGLANPQITQQEAGIILNVTPRINPDGQIVMYVNAEKSAFLSEGVPIFTDATNGNVIESPIRDIRSAVTTVSVPSGQTVVIGGMITSSNETTERKVPWLGDIPVIGYAFRYDSRATKRTELLIFLTPRLVRDDIEAEVIKDVEMARMHFIESELEEVHGPLRSVPGAEGIPLEMMSPPTSGPESYEIPATPPAPGAVPGWEPAIKGTPMSLPGPAELPPAPGPEAARREPIRDSAIQTVSAQEQFWEQERLNARSSTGNSQSRGTTATPTPARSRIPWLAAPKKSK